MKEIMDVLIRYCSDYYPDEEPYIKSFYEPFAQEIMKLVADVKCPVCGKYYANKKLLADTIKYQIAREVMEEFYSECRPNDTSLFRPIVEYKLYLDKQEDK